MVGWWWGGEELGWVVLGACGCLCDGNRWGVLVVYLVFNR